MIKKFFKSRNLIVTGAIMALLGGILLFSGIVTGGTKRYITFDDGYFQVVGNEVKTETHKLSSDVKTMYIEADALNVTVKVGGEFSVRSELTNRKLNITAHGNSAIINTTSGFTSTFFSFGSFSSGKIIVTVPSAEQLDELDISMGAGSIYVENLQLQKLIGNIDASSLTVKGAKVESLNFENINASTIRLNDTTVENDGEIDMDASTLRVANSKLPALSVRGDASSLKIDGARKKLPYNEEASGSALRIEMDASSTIIDY
jgi:hypothetical protein